MVEPNKEINLFLRESLVTLISTCVPDVKPLINVFFPLSFSGCDFPVFLVLEYLLHIDLGQQSCDMGDLYNAEYARCEQLFHS